MDFLNKLVEIDSIFQSLFGMGFFSGILVLIKISWSKNKTLSDIVEKQNQLLEKQNSMENRITDIEREAGLRRDASLASLHDRIYSFCTRIINRGNATIKELDNLEYLWQAYSGLGGNGTGELLVNKVKELPIVDDNDIGD